MAVRGAYTSPVQAGPGGVLSINGGLWRAADSFSVGQAVPTIVVTRSAVSVVKGIAERIKNEAHTVSKSKQETPKPLRSAEKVRRDRPSEGRRVRYASSRL